MESRRSTPLKTAPSRKRGRLAQPLGTGTTLLRCPCCWQSPCPPASFPERGPPSLTSSPDVARSHPWLHMAVVLLMLSGETPMLERGHPDQTPPCPIPACFFQVSTLQL